ncbi:DUF4145 domain-containing protein [Roseibacillus persicicus]|uniref:hypothetical protein n=1 Tax=Roseibacillus persicicus TaxID=454148 RepID=UPI00398B1950
MSKEVESSGQRESDLQSALGLFCGAREEYSLGYREGLRREISNELVVDMYLHAESLLGDGYQQSAAVLAAAALEDCFKRRVEDSGFQTEGKTLTDYISKLKSDGQLSGATAKIVSGFPKFRNAAMHADWDRITDAEVSSVCAFIKKFSVQ